MRNYKPLRDTGRMIERDRMSQTFTLQELTERAEAWQATFASPDGFAAFAAAGRQSYSDPARTPSKRALLARVKAGREKQLGRALADNAPELYG